MALASDRLIEIPDYAGIRDRFCDELTWSVRGETTSLPFIRNTLPKAPLVQSGETFQVFVIGGTNGEAATVRYDSGDIKLLKYKAYPELPKFKTAADFLTFIDRNLDESTKAVGVNFGFTLTPLAGEKGQLDGVLMGGDTKGHGFEGLLRQRVGATIEKYFRQKYQRKLVVAVANDAVCLLTARAGRVSNHETTMAGIVGTGYNMAFFLDEHTIVNVQASDFTGFNPTATGTVVDRESSNVGEQLYSKEVAAGELYKHYNVIVDEYGLADKIGSTKELARLAVENAGRDGDVARALLRRSASLVAAQFAGFYNFKDRPERLLAVMQGSLFWNGPQYREMVAEELERLGVPAGAIAFERVDRADVLGAAKLITAGSRR